MTDWLVDRSALVRLANSRDATEWTARIDRGLIRIATVTRLEIGYSARSGADFRAGLQCPPLSAVPVEYQTPAIEDPAVEVLMLLADRGQHRAPSIPDLIVAATAELAPIRQTLPGASRKHHPLGPSKQAVRIPASRGASLGGRLDASKPAVTALSDHG